MNKVNEILNNDLFKKYIKELETLETDREFCKHNMEHSLDVARIAYIKVLEENINISKEVIYAVALLHDIGRVLQYKDGTPHHKGSVIISEEILKDTSFSREEKDIIIDAIKEHREELAENDFQSIIQISDKLSRNCYNCKAYDKCYWDYNKKNHIIKY
ncbi:HD domain-containing protein [Clostridium sp. Ade.TY]|uniref:HD domain-containing protein n=1 Tax=Clostridium sp. Ade.TY TaxID=1391647 RepID=UPI000417BBBA|nr:HD domain-containing protein [Clostridium sp. Ade.TY]